MQAISSDPRYRELARAGTAEQMFKEFLKELESKQKVSEEVPFWHAS
jgi:hypothetical protein